MAKQPKPTKRTETKMREDWSKMNSKPQAKSSKSSSDNGIMSTISKGVNAISEGIGSLYGRPTITYEKLAKGMMEQSESKKAFARDREEDVKANLRYEAIYGKKKSRFNPEIYKIETPKQRLNFAKQLRKEATDDSITSVRLSEIAESKRKKK